MNLISQKEFKGDALESLRGVMILSSIHWRTSGPFTIHESLHFHESVSESCMIQLTYVFSLVSYRWYMYPLSLSFVIYNLVLPSGWCKHHLSQTSKIDYFPPAEFMKEAGNVFSHAN